MTREQLSNQVTIIRNAKGLDLPIVTTEKSCVPRSADERLCLSFRRNGLGFPQKNVTIF